MKDLLFAHWWKAGIVLITGGLLTWGTWSTLHGFLAERNQEAIVELKAYVDMQVGVLHGRQTAAVVGQEADETRLENRLWELQLRFFEDEIADLKEEDNSGR